MSTLDPPPKMPSDRIPEIGAKTYLFLMMYFMMFLWVWGAYGLGVVLEITALLIAVPILLRRFKFYEQPKIETEPSKVTTPDFDQWEQEL